MLYVLYLFFTKKTALWRRVPWGDPTLVSYNQPHLYLADHGLSVLIGWSVVFCDLVKLSDELLSFSTLLGYCLLQCLNLLQQLEWKKRGWMSNKPYKVTDLCTFLSAISVSLLKIKARISNCAQVYIPVASPSSVCPCCFSGLHTLSSLLGCHPPGWKWCFWCHS